MAISPTNRVRYLLNLPLDTSGYRDPITQSPATLSGGDHGLYSYRLCIAWRDGEDWLVTNEKSSPTTNRHIAAVHRVIGMEYQNVGEERTDGRHVTRYQPYN